jgi:iron-sulfur cluster assembly accessory protein
MQEQAQAITKDMLIGEAVSQYPEVADVFLSYGLHCVGCHVNAYESIEQGSLGHGMTPEEVEEMVAETNEYIKQMRQPKEGFTISPKAVQKLHELSEAEGKTGQGLRIIVSGCCSTPNYELDFDTEKPGDTVIANEFTVYLDTESAEKLQGASLDYLETERGAGFKITNPGIKQHCGCKH